MDRLVKDFLDQVVERLDKIQKHQESQHNKQPRLDQVIERLDTIRNYLLKQNQKQNMLDERISSVTSMIEQEKLFVRAQLKETQDDMQARLKDMQKKGDASKTRVLYDEILTRLDAIQVSSNSNDATMSSQSTESRQEEMMTRIEQELKCMNNKLISPALVEVGLAENVNPGVAQITDTVEESVKSVTRAELVWLDSQMDQRMSDFSTTVNEKLLEVSAEMNRLAKQRDETGDALMKEIRDTILSLSSQIREDILKSTDILKHEIQSLKQDVDDKLATAVAKLRENIGELRDEDDKMTSMDRMTQSVSAVKEEVKEHIDKVKNEITEAAKKRSKLMMDRLGGIHTAHRYMKSELLKSYAETSQELQRYGEAKLSEATIQMKDTVCKVKRELYAITEKEAQLIRDRIAGPLPSHSNYTCDLYVEDFKNLINSVKYVCSPHWHVNQFQSSVMGNVYFNPCGKMDVWLIYGRHPREVGLQPRSGTKLKIKATIVDTSGELPDITVGEGTWACEETGIKDNRDRGIRLGDVSCEELLQGGYGEKEGYWYGALLVRYEIKICK